MQSHATEESARASKQNRRRIVRQAANQDIMPTVYEKKYIPFPRPLDHVKFSSRKTLLLPRQQRVYLRRLHPFLQQIACTLFENLLRQTFCGGDRRFGETRPVTDPRDAQVL